MSLLTLHRSSLEREEKRAAAEYGKVAQISTKIVQKQAELNRAKTPSQQGRLSRQLQSLLADRAAAEKAHATHQKRSTALRAKIIDEEAAEQKNLARRQERADRDRDRSQRAVEQRISITSEEVERLSARVSVVEDALMDRVREAVAEDPVEREHDVFLSHAGPDTEVAGELYRELTARELDVWFDEAEIRLGESLTRQLDRGIARSRVGVLLVTEAFVKGRYWTEREFGAFLSSRKRVIPVLDGVNHEILSSYSPLLGDLVGLSTETEGFDEIAVRVAAALALN